MVVEPKVRGFICTTAHPVGCKENVKRQIDYVKKSGQIRGPKKVLVIGGSAGYGLASRITATFGCGASTIGIMFEKLPTEKRPATPGWYNTQAFEQFAAKDGYYAKTINGDAFSKEVKEKAIEIIRKDLGQVDMVVYSLAAPRRTMPDGSVCSSVLKTTGGTFINKSLDLRTNQIIEASIPVATEDEVRDTVKVMGGEDWFDWIMALSEANVLNNNCKTIAFSYIGPELTYPVYFNGTIGMAKKHLYDTSCKITQSFSNVHAYISVNKAFVTQASAAIPIVPLYMAILYKVMKERGIHEDCIRQINRLFHEKWRSGEPETDRKGQIRLDDYEMRTDVQEDVMHRWDAINTENINELADLTGYWDDFYHMFGFGFDNVNYMEDISLI